MTCRRNATRRCLQIEIVGGSVSPKRSCYWFEIWRGHQQTLAAAAGATLRSLELVPSRQTQRRCMLKRGRLAVITVQPFGRWRNRIMAEVACCAYLSDFARIENLEDISLQRQFASRHLRRPRTREIPRVTPWCRSECSTLGKSSSALFVQAVVARRRCVIGSATGIFR